MNWTHEQLKQLGYSEQPDGSFARTECVSPRIPHAQPQPHLGQTLDRPFEGEGENRPRFGLRITRIACQLLDADNFAGGCKFLVDALGWPIETFKGKPVKSAIRIICQNIRKVIFKPNAIGEGPPRCGSNSPSDVTGGSSPPTC